MFQDGRIPTPGPPEDYVYEELLTRTSWCNAEYASREIERVWKGDCVFNFLSPELSPLWVWGGDCAFQVNCKREISSGGAIQRG